MFMAKIAVIIVTHNSQAVLPSCMASVTKYGGECFVCLVDSGSDDPSYLKDYEQSSRISIIYLGDKGFGQANNAGYQLCADKADYFVFLNPDALITEQTFTAALKALQGNLSAGCVGARLLGYDFKIGKPLTTLDSTGIFRRWYGRWFDRGQGEPDTGQYNSTEVIPAACAAFLFCRKKMIEQVSLKSGVFFDPDFFLYKEDIELGLRIRKSCWDTLYVPEVLVYHGRGWQLRKKITKQTRLTAAANEILLYTKHPSPYIVWALFKYFLVRFLNI
jgi:GT2 family glycosyltransferase